MFCSVSVCVSKYLCTHVLQCHCVFQCAAASSSLYSNIYVHVCSSVLQCFAVFCSVLQCVAVCCSVLQCVAMCCSVLQCVAVCSSTCVRVCLLPRVRVVWVCERVPTTFTHTSMTHIHDTHPCALLHNTCQKSVKGSERTQAVVVCVCACVCERERVCVYVCMCVCACVCVCVLVSACVFARMFVRMTCVCVCTYVCIYMVVLKTPHNAINFRTLQHATTHIAT